MSLRRLVGLRPSPHRATFGSRTVVTALANVVLAGLGVGTGVLAARLLGTEGRGHLAAIQLWPSFIGTLAMLGLPEALVYFSAREKRHAGERLSTAVAVALIAAVPFGIVGYALMPALLSAQSLRVIQTARWYLLIIPIFAVVGMLYHPLRGRGHFLAWNLLRILPSVGWLLLLSFTAARGGATAAGLAERYLVVLAVLILPVGLTVLRKVPGPFTPRSEHARPLLAYGVPNAITAVPQALNLRLDQMLMAGLLPANALGLYVVAVAWGNATQPLLSAIGTVLFPGVAARRTPKARAEVLKKGIHLSEVLALALCGALILIAPWSLPFLFGPEFTSAVSTAQVMTVAGVLWGLNLVIEEALRGLGHPTAILRAEIGGLVVTAVALAVLLPLLQIIGAAVASVLGYATVTMFLLRSTSAHTGLPVRTLLRPDLVALLQRVRSAIHPHSNLDERRRLIKDDGP